MMMMMTMTHSSDASQWTACWKLCVFFRLTFLKLSRPISLKAVGVRSFWSFYEVFFLFQHPFISQPLSRTLAIELLDKVSNPDQTSYQDHLEDDETDAEVKAGSTGLSWSVMSADICWSLEKMLCVNEETSHVQLFITWSYIISFL